MTDTPVFVKTNVGNVNYEGYGKEQRGRMSEREQLAGLTDEQVTALRAALATFKGCGLEKLDGSNLLALGEHFMLCLTDAERHGYEQGWSNAIEYNNDLRTLATLPPSTQH